MSNKTPPLPRFIEKSDVLDFLSVIEQYRKAALVGMTKPQLTYAISWLNLTDHRSYTLVKIPWYRNNYFFCAVTYKPKVVRFIEKWAPLMWYEPKHNAAATKMDDEKNREMEFEKGVLIGYPKCCARVWAESTGGEGDSYPGVWVKGYHPFNPCSKAHAERWHNMYIAAIKKYKLEKKFPIYEFKGIAL